MRWQWDRDGRRLVAAPVAAVGACQCSTAELVDAQQREDLPRLVVAQRGVSRWNTGRRTQPIGPGRMVALAPGEPFQSGHPAGYRGVCLTLVPSPHLWAALAESAGLPDRGFGCVCALIPAAALFQAELLVRVAHADDADHLAELAPRYVGDLAGYLARAVAVGPVPPRRPAGDIDIAERAVEFLAAHYREPIPRPLDSAAAAARCSASHLSRVFRREVGSTVHAFREWLRLADALHAVAEGDISLAMLAARLGYASHSHLTENFRRTYGMTPSVARNMFARPGVELSAILEGAAVSRSLELEHG